MQGKTKLEFARTCILRMANIAWHFFVIVGFIAILNRWGNVFETGFQGTLAEYIVIRQTRIGSLGQPIGPSMIGLGIGMTLVLYVISIITYDQDQEDEEET